MRGWGLVVRPDACAALPAQGKLIRLTGLAREVIMRASCWPLDQPLDAARQRLAAVLLDELCHAQIDHLHLPMPADRRLLRIDRQLLDNPADPRPLDAWADWGGLSPRSLSRHFRDETGLSFAQWRQQARLTEGLRRLSQGSAVAQAADQLGYSSPVLSSASSTAISAPRPRDIWPAPTRAAWHPPPHPDNRRSSSSRLARGFLFT